MDIVYLVLENGMAFAGHPIGAWKGIDPGLETVGELVFTTGMTGYLETLTDPSYAGQIILQTFPMIGNYGLIPEDLRALAMRRAMWCGNSATVRRTSAVKALWTPS